MKVSRFVNFFLRYLRMLVREVARQGYSGRLMSLWRKIEALWGALLSCALDRIRSRVWIL